MTTILIISAIFFVLCLSVFMIGKPALLPKAIVEKIHTLQKANMPELLKGEKGFAQNGAIEIFYEVLSNGQAKGDILLINGHSHSLLLWPSSFIQPLVDAGYRIIRFDNRGLGNSNWVKNWNKDIGYSLEEMATDALAVLDHLNIEKVHVIGMSMGGMIGQRLAISHGERLKTLTSIMSTGFYFDPKLTSVPLPFIIKILTLQIAYGRNLKPEINKIKLHVAVQRLLMGKGNYAFNDKEHILNALYEIRRRKSFNGKASEQHSLAIKKSGSRYDELGQIKTPTLVIHGTDDPLIYVNHAEKYAPKIPNAKKLILQGMGHDLPEKYLDEIHSNILNMTSTN